jgi:hypothetical protein
MTHRFFDYVNRRLLNSKRKLKIIHKMLNSAKVKSKLSIKNTDDPHLFVYSTDPGCDFEGIRIYAIGSNIAFRIQNRSDTHPYGKSYLLDFENVFNTFMSKKDAKAEDSGKEVMKHFVEEIKKFFKMSADAQNNFDKSDNKLMLRNTGTDYSSNVYSKF